MAAPSRKKRPASKKRSAPHKKNVPRGNPSRPRVSGSPQVVRRATVGQWIGGARLRTLPLAIAPVVIGTASALIVDPAFHWVIALACLAVAVCMQIGVNFANDYSDGLRGTDAYRVGPTRLTASGRAKPGAVRAVALGFFALAALAGIAIVIRTGHWWLLGIGVVAILAGWFYTGGKRPYGYFGLGEVFVFVFFGLFATLGTAYVQSGAIPGEAWFGAVAIGLLACAVLLVNNLRDLSQDRAAGKRTLAVLIGRLATRILFTLFVLAPFLLLAAVAVLYPIAWIGMLVLLPALAAILIVWTYRNPQELVVALTVTSLTALAYAGAFAWALLG